MKVIEKETKTTTRDFGGLCKLTFIALAVFALVMLPYKVDLNNGSLKTTVLLADDDSGDGGHDSEGSQDSDSDSDHNGYDSGGSHESDSGHDSYESGDDGDDGEHDSDVDENDGDDHESDDQKSSHDGSIGSESASGSSDELLDVGGVQGLKEISSEDEASLVGNWGKSSTP